ncbi:MAG: zinc ABC transporter substrate-binding protein [Lachnospiraceae bacterium]|nr:zinc ABC transporter substrate-binding protein [Lachnospiraceae bacterium]
MKIRISFLMTVLFLTVFLCACAPDQAVAGEQVSAADDSISIVTTIFPEYDWVRSIVGDNPAGAEISMLLDNGVDLHSYQPTAADILNIARCDLFIYVGGESDKWVDDALKEAVNKDMIVIDLLDELGSAVKEEELVEGMEVGEEDHEGEEEEPEYDEHVWLSLKNSRVLCGVIEAALEKIDSSNASLYKSNLDAYLAELDALDKEYAAVVAGSDKDTVLFADRFPFRYLADDYGLKYYAAFAGCSAESEASFETVTFLAGKVDELSLKRVLVIESSDGKIAETVIANTSSADASVLTMNSIQSVTADDVKAGISYLGLMQQNLEVLKEALQ